MKQTNPEKISRAQGIMEELRKARGGTLLKSHQVMGNDPNLINAFLQQYLNCNKRDVEIPRKYRELIVMAIGMATGTSTTMKVHANLAVQNGASINEEHRAIMSTVVQKVRSAKSGLTEACSSLLTGFEVSVLKCSRSITA